MKQASIDYLNKIEDTLRTYIPRLTIDGVEVDGELQTGMTISLGSCGTETFSIGGVFIPSITVSISECTTKLQDKELFLEMGLVIDDETVEYMPIGYFTVEKPSVSKGVTTFTAYGRLMSKGGVLYSSALTYPTTLQNVINEISAAMGVPVILNDLEATGQIGTPIKGELCRDALGVVAGLLGGFVTEDSAGNIVISKYALNESLPLSIDFCYEYPEMNETEYAVTGLEVIVREEGTEEDGTVAEGEKYYSDTPINVVALNPHMNESLFEICESNVVGLSYMPTSIRFLGELRLEPWDYIALTDGEGTTNVPCMSIEHVWDGGLVTTVTAPGATAAEVESNYKGPTGAMVEKVHMKTLSLEKLIAQKIDAEYLKSNYIEANDLHISGKSTFEDKIVLDYGAEYDVVLSVEKKELGTGGYGWNNGEFALLGGVRIDPCLIIDSQHGMYVNGSFYASSGVFESVYTQNMHTNKAYINGGLYTNNNVYLSKNAEGIFTGGKTVYNDGKSGALINNKGRIYLTGASDATSGIFFYPTTANASSGASIQYDATNDYLQFVAATMYTFGNTVRVPNNVAFVGLNNAGTQRVNMAWISDSDNLILGGGTYSPNQIRLRPGSGYSVFVESALLTTGAVLTNGKTGYGDGAVGCDLSNNGRLYLQGGESTPGIFFYHGGQTSAGANITYDSSTDKVNIGSSSGLTVGGTAVSLSGHEHGWTKVTPTKGSTTTFSADTYCAYNTALNMGFVRLSLTIKPTADVSAGTSITVATLPESARPGYTCALASAVGSTNARRWSCALNTNGTINVRPSTALTKDTEYALYICGAYPVTV